MHRVDVALGVDQQCVRQSQHAKLFRDVAFTHGADNRWPRDGLIVEEVLHVGHVLVDIDPNKLEPLFLVDILQIDQFGQFVLDECAVARRPEEYVDDLPLVLCPIKGHSL